MAFADAVFDGHAVLEGVRAVRAGDLRDLSSILPARTVVPVIIIDFTETLEVVRPEVLVDAVCGSGAGPRFNSAWRR